LLGIALAHLHANQGWARCTSLDANLHHLRAGDQREWSDFPERAEATSLTLRFQSQRNDGEWALRLRQQDVKQSWRVLLNGKELGRLLNDENDTVLYLKIPGGTLLNGENKLVIEPADRISDDIRVGDIRLDERPVAEVLAEAKVELIVREAGPDNRLVPVPCRITVVDDQGALVMLGAHSGEGMAVRPGVIYTRDGKACFGLPAGDYTLYAGRGFEYGLASVRITLQSRDSIRKELTIRREVFVAGWVSCDTHVHTLTHSGHGDATLDERAITIAGEGIELPVSTEHNKQVSYHSAAVRQGVRDYFTPVIGNEVTTNVGHFNIFPVRSEDEVPDFQAKDWKSLFAGIRNSNTPRVIVLNHPRDLHAGFRPFGQERHVALAGENIDGWDLQATAMEVLNSGGQQTDVMRLLHDWFGLLNAGRRIAPVGASDSHDVSRYIVGQGRTYLRCPDDRPGAVNVDKAMRSFAAGRVMVSCGLLAEITVNGKYGPGELAAAPGDVSVTVRVLGPGWTTADKLELYMNGRKLREVRIEGGQRPGVKWEGSWTLPHCKHDYYLAAVATGPGVTGLYWPIAKPYQPTSPKVERRVLGATGAVWIDGDGDGQWTSAREYAMRLWREAKEDVPKFIGLLGNHDEATAVQAAALLRAKGVSLYDVAVLDGAKTAGQHVEIGFRAYADAWRESQLARARPR
jgi:hypothetical protein